MIHFLVDAQLLPALARWLTDNGYQASHVFDCDLGEASDKAIWRYAEKSGASIITKDEDFVTLRIMESTGPHIVWIRKGNTTKQELLSWFEPVLPLIEKVIVSGEKLIEVA